MTLIPRIERVHLNGVSMSTEEEISGHIPCNNRELRLERVE